MTPGLAQLAQTMNSAEPFNSPLYYKNIEGFYYGYQDPEECCKRFGWKSSEFKFALKPTQRLHELVKNMHVPLYGDVDYERKILATKRGNSLDPADLYVQQLSYFSLSRLPITTMDLQNERAKYEGQVD